MQYSSIDLTINMENSRIEVKKKTIYFYHCWRRVLSNRWNLFEIREYKNYIILNIIEYNIQLL